MYEIIDDDLGKILIKPHHSARRFIMRHKNGGYQLTVPQTATRRAIVDAVEQLKPKLKHKAIPETPLINENSQIKTLTFFTKFHRCASQDKFSIRLKDNQLNVYVPHDSDFNDLDVQHTIKELIIYALRKEAQRVLPPKVARFAQQTKMQYKQVKINRSQSRWGSCSTAGNINLSLFLLFLPEELIDYVILHELAHTVEMNHSARFWNLLDSFCDGKSHYYRQRLKTFQSESYAYFMV